MRSTLSVVSLLVVLPFTSAVPGTSFRERATSSNNHIYMRTGCYTLKALEPLLPPLNPDAVTVAACIDACDGKNHAYAGVGNKQCRCGNYVIGGIASSISDLYCMALTCNTGGGSMEYCGSDATLVIYSDL